MIKRNGKEEPRQKINKEWLQQQLIFLDLHFNNDIDNYLASVDEFTKTIQKNVECGWNDGRLTIEIILTFDVGLFISDKLKTFQSYLDLPERERGNEVCLLNACKEEIKLAKEAIDKKFSQTMSVFAKSSIDTKQEMAILECLNYIEGKKISINKNLSKILKYQHFGLDIADADDGIFPVDTYDIDQAVRRLGGTRQNLLELYFRSKGKFGVYLQAGKFRISTSLRFPTKVNEVKEREDCYIYPYSYRGYVRLADDSIRMLYEGKNIDAARTSNQKQLIILQESLSQICRGESEMLMLQGSQKITLNDLIFMQDEIDQVIGKKRGDSEGKSYSSQLEDRGKPTKQKRKYALHEKIKAIHAKSRDKSAMHIWRQLKDMAVNGQDSIVQEVSNWTDREASIYWCSHRDGRDRCMKRGTFENYISKLNKSSHS